MDEEQIKALMKYVKNTIWIQMVPVLCLLFAVQICQGVALLYLVWK